MSRGQQLCHYLYRIVLFIVLIFYKFLLKLIWYIWRVIMWGTSCGSRLFELTLQLRRKLGKILGWGLSLSGNWGQWPWFCQVCLFWTFWVPLIKLQCVCEAQLKGKPLASSYLAKYAVNLNQFMGWSLSKKCKIFCCGGRIFRSASLSEWCTR